MCYSRTQPIKGIAPPTFDGRHSEQMGSKRCGIGISRNKAKFVH